MNTKQTHTRNIRIISRHNKYPESEIRKCSRYSRSQEGIRISLKNGRKQLSKDEGPKVGGMTKLEDLQKSYEIDTLKKYELELKT